MTLPGPYRIIRKLTEPDDYGKSVDTAAHAIVTFVKPDGFVAAAHVHPHQEERCEILDDSVCFGLG